MDLWWIWKLWMAAGLPMTRGRKKGTKKFYCFLPPTRVTKEMHAQIEDFWQETDYLSKKADAIRCLLETGLYYKNYRNTSNNIDLPKLTIEESDIADCIGMPHKEYARQKLKISKRNKKF